MRLDALPRRRFLGGAACALALSPRAHAATRAAALQDSAPIRLTTHAGAPFDSARDLAGRPMLVYFGFTFCPDVCPTMLSALGMALEALEAERPEARDIGFLFVSVDPERDDAAALAQYVPHFHPRLVGLTGSAAAIDALARAWRVTYARVGAGDDYLVDHPAFAYGLDREHRVVSYLWSYAAPTKLAAQVGALL